MVIATCPPPISTAAASCPACGRHHPVGGADAPPFGGVARTTAARAQGFTVLEARPDSRR